MPILSVPVHPGPLPVLIVGAGPTGLALALDLARRGIALRIIDRLPGPAQASRAKGIQPRTLEVFDDLGIVADILAAGGPFPPWRTYAGETVLGERSIYTLLGMADPVPAMRTPYPETWMLPQWRTEAILRQAVAAHGILVEYGTELLGLEVAATHAVATLAQESGVHRVQARFLVGTDGGRSTVRRLLGIAFPGETRADDHYLIADVEAPGLERDIWHNWALPDDPTQRISLCSLPQTPTFQVVAPLRGPAPPLDLATLQALFWARSGRHDIALMQVSWITHHRVNLRLATRFRVGPVFLAGDAAHAPPPAGGQGLNLSIQDGYNLGWKLAAVLRGAPDTLLDSYEAERRPIAARLFQGAPIMADADDPLASQLDEADPDVFQLKVRYRRSVLTWSMRAESGPLQAGDRAPNAQWSRVDDPHTVFACMRGPHFTVLTFDPAVGAACRQVTARWATRVAIRVVTTALPRRESAAAAWEVYEVGDSATIVVIRPDGYIGLITDHASERVLERYLTTVLGVADHG
jgi:2-polyprenyl-6-methoxyphenol hydroxylase-like FAD-dependent oxidoreductase